MKGYKGGRERKNVTQHTLHYWETPLHQHENTCKSSHCYYVTQVNRETSQPSYVRTSVNPAIRASGDMKTPLRNVVDAHSFNLKIL